MDMVDGEVSGFYLNFNLFRYWILLMLAFFFLLFFNAQIGGDKTQHSIF